MQLILTPREGSALCGLLVEEADDIILKTDPRGFVVEASHGLDRFGFVSEGLLVWPHLADLAGGSAGEAIRAAHREVMLGLRAGAAIEFAGGPGHFALQLRAVAGDDGRTAGALGVLRDIGERRSMEERLFAAEMTDVLTGLTNRRAFTAMLAHLATLPGEHGLALFDIDHFRAINRRHGAQTGDEALVAVAEFLRAALSPRETISRVGGGRFAVLLPWTGLAEARQTCRELLAAMDEISRAASGGALAITLSAGLTRVGQSPDAAIDRAETGLYLARASGGNSLCMRER